MKTSECGIALIKKMEGCKLTAYQDSVGVWTIGYGVTSEAGFGTIKRGMKITQEQADEWLVRGLVQYEKAVQGALTVAPTQNQFDAMVGLCWNIGGPRFSKSSVVKNHNAKAFGAAARSFLLWNKAGGKVLDGLNNRRAHEAALYALPMPAISSPAPVPPPKAPEPPKPTPAPVAPIPAPIVTEKPGVNPIVWVVAGLVFAAVVAIVVLESAF